MKKIIVSDTTALIILTKTNHLNLLNNFVDKVYIPNAVFDEITFKDDIVKYNILKCDFIEKKQVEDLEQIKKVKEKTNLDKGEVEAICLAMQTKLDLIIDEKLGRKFALSYGIEILGLLGILEINLLLGKITYIELLYILEEFKSVDYRLSPKLEKQFLENLKSK
ncbi:MAG: hypothetical protein KGV43_01390 [Arcobacter sp.]|nr:hypothetical protein [Arcobacter sp.]